MDFRNTIEISKKTCDSCCQILYPLSPINEKDARISHISLAPNERLARLLSEAGLDVPVHQSTFRAAVASGCTICKDLNDVAERWSYDDRLAQFCLRNSTSKDRVGKIAEGEERDKQDLENATAFTDAVLMINFHADTISDSLQIPGQEKASTQISDPLDIKELHVSPLGAHERWNTSVNFDILALSTDPASRFITTRPINPEMGTPASVEVVKGWIRHCTQSHPLCPASQSIPRLPTRVIDVGDSAKGEQPRIFTTNGLMGEYACLSYCWGGPQPVTLTKATLREMQKILSLNDLPNSLQDSVWWTRQLGLRYLWIDALCIIQDDELDKAREITAMDSIYMSSFITFSAAKARTCHSGFRQPSLPPNSQNPFTWGEVAFPCPDGSGVGTLIIQPRCTYHTSLEWLNRRGWTLQESLLSPRVLTFGCWQLYWNCQNAEFANGGKMDLFEPRPMRLSQEVFMGVQGQLTNGRLAVYDLWISIVEQYVRRQLSYWEDRLPALAGIVVPFQRLLGPNNTYLAGLWLGDMPRSMAWRVYHSDDAESDDDEQRYDTGFVRSPGSWSWASIRFDASWPYMDVPPPEDEELNGLFSQTRVEAHDVEPCYVEAPFGQVIRAELVVHGVAKYFNWNGDEVIFDRPENCIPTEEARIGDPLRVNEYHVALLHADYRAETVALSEMCMEEHDRDMNEEDSYCIFYTGRGITGNNDSRNRRVVAVPVSCHAAIILGRAGRETLEGNEYANNSAVSNEHMDREDVSDKGTKFVRLGLLEFDFVAGINWVQNVTDFFAGCETGTFIIK